MDRVVCLIVLTVVASLVFEISNAAAATAEIPKYETQSSVPQVHKRADVELVQPVDTARSYYVNQRQSQRNSLFDNIFRVNIFSQNEFRGNRNVFFCLSKMSKCNKNHLFFSHRFQFQR